MPKRDSNGRFIESSVLDKKSLGVRLLKEDREKLELIAEERGVAVGVLARLAINEWLNGYPKNEGDRTSNFKTPIAA